MTIQTFKRYENKYLLNKEQFAKIKKVLPHYMREDENNGRGTSYTIYNIYYDTENNDIIRNSIAKPYYKEKLRLRSYYLPSAPTDQVFLELKKKIGGVVSKRRAKMTLLEATRLIEAGIKPQSATYESRQVMEEIIQFLAMYKVSPKVFISYDRMAFFGKEDSNFRVTFDNHILTRRKNEDQKGTLVERMLLEENQYLMEVKISGGVPIWLCRLLAEEKVYSTSFSKYGTEYKKYCAGHRRICHA